MDPEPRPFRELPWDADLDGPVPFACGTPALRGMAGEAPPSARTLDVRRVTQCALSRVCGVCGAPLGRPIAFLGSTSEEDRNAFHFPPCHLSCAEDLRAAYVDSTRAVLGQHEPVTSWVLVTTAAFEYLRPGKADLDRRPTFQPHLASTQSDRSAGRATSVGRGPL